MCHDPGDEDRSECTTCPFCGRSLAYRSTWVTPLREEPFNDWYHALAKPLSPDDCIMIQQLVTCRRDACKDEAKKIQRESFKSVGRKQHDAYNARMRRLCDIDPPVGFKDEWRL